VQQISPKFHVCTTKTLCFTGAQKCAPNELPGAAGIFGSGGRAGLRGGATGAIALGPPLQGGPP